MRQEAEAHTTLIPGAAEIARWIARRGIAIGSGTGYTREMMAGILPRAAAQGYAPQAVVCADDTKEGRPSPLPMWKALLDLGAWPTWRCVKVDDAVVGVAEGRAAGAWTVGIAASGNGVGLDLEAWQALSEAERDKRTEACERELLDAGADYVVATVADLETVFVDIERRLAAGDRPRL